MLATWVKTHNRIAQKHAFQWRPRVYTRELLFDPTRANASRKFLPTALALSLPCKGHFMSLEEWGEGKKKRAGDDGNYQHFSLFWNVSRALIFSLHKIFNEDHIESQHIHESNTSWFTSSVHFASSFPDARTNQTIRLTYSLGLRRNCRSCVCNCDDLLFLYLVFFIFKIYSKSVRPKSHAREWGQL